MTQLRTIFLLIFITGCSSVNKTAAIASPQVIIGTVNFLEQIKLPVNAKLTMKLYDVSLMDVPAILMAETVLTLSDKASMQLPINFEISYLAEKIKPQHTYSVQAVITINHKMIYTSTASYPVITRGNGKHVDIVLQQVKNSNSPLQSAKKVEYSCKNNRKLTVSYTSANDEAIAIINGQHRQPIILPAKPTASGFLYSNGKHTLRGKAGDLQWTIGRMMPIKCTVADKRQIAKDVM